MSIVEQRSRAPDAAQRYFSAAQQRKDAAARPGHAGNARGRRSSQIPRQLSFHLPIDGVLDLAARDPDVAQSAVVELVQRLDGGAVLQAVEQRIDATGERAEKSAR